jgi:hypothetical protein
MALAACAATTASDQGTSALSATTEDASASGIAAGAVGGALTGANGNGTQALMRFQAPASSSLYAALKSALDPFPSALASALCPTPRAPESGCSTSGSAMWLVYDACQFAGAATWTGTQSLSMSSGAAACGTFPNPGANGTLYRQYVQSAGSTTPGQVALATKSFEGAVDDASANLANFDSDALAAINGNGGYGANVSFGATGARDALAIGHHISVTGVYDHSVYGNLAIAESAGATSRTVSGSVKVYHNLLKIIGTAAFNGVVHEDICCLPVAGSIATTFSAGVNVSPTAAGAKAVGKTETLTFTGCGTATLQSYDGMTSSVTLSRCF